MPPYIHPPTRNPASFGTYSTPFTLPHSKLGFKIEPIHPRYFLISISNFEAIMSSTDCTSSDSLSGETCNRVDDFYNDRERIEKEKFFLPIASVSRIMRIGVPWNWKISNDAKDAMQESASEFISFITSEASVKCKRENRKTINGDDVLWAMSVLGFEDYTQPLKLYLAKYRKMEAIHSHSARTKERNGS